MLGSLVLLGMADAVVTAVGNRRIQRRAIIELLKVSPMVVVLLFVIFVAKAPFDHWLPVTIAFALLAMSTWARWAVPDKTTTTSSWRR